jgi:hypothetical protein
MLRIYQVSQSDPTKVCDTGYATNGKGRTKFVGVKSSVLHNLEDVQKAGFPILAVASNLSSKMANYNNNGLPYAVTQAEGAHGQQQLVRVEVPGFKGSEFNMYNLTITNTSAVAQQVMVGDGGGFCAAGLGLPTVNAVNVISGSWGAGSLAQLKAGAIVGGFDTHVLHLQSASLSGGTPGDPAGNGGAGTPGTGQTITDNDRFFTSGGSVQTVEGSLLNNSPATNRLPLQMMTDSGTFSTYIRLLNDYRYIFGGYTGLLVTLPGLTQLALSFYVSAIGNGALMNKQVQ